MPENTVLVIEGKLVSVLPKQEGEGRNGRWQRQSIVVEMMRGSYATMVCFDVWGDQVNTVASLQIGDMLTISFDPSSREFNGRWYTSLRAWRIVVGTGSNNVADRPSTIGVIDQQPMQTDANPTQDTPPAPTERDEFDAMPENDLPF